MADQYRYDPLKRAYIGPNGRPISIAVIRALRDSWADIQAEVMRGFAANVGSGVWTIAEFEAAARIWLGETIGAGYQLGRGGAGMMTPDDAFELARLISEQGNRMEMLIWDHQQGRMTPAQFEARAEAHAGAAVQAFEKGQAETAGLSLPVYPADGSTSCHWRCRCYWEIEETDTTYEATWVTVGDENVCPECEQYGEEYAPFIQDK